MANRVASLAALAALGWLTGAGVAGAQEFTPRTEFEALIGSPKPVPEIPEDLRPILSAASPDRLVVRSLSGADIMVDVEWYLPGEYQLYEDGRFLGMSLGGYESYGYYLVDRAQSGAGAVIETGSVPVFSGDGHYFAAAELSDAGYSNLEGIGVWEVRRDGSVRRFFTDALTGAFDWRVDRWRGAECVSISAIDSSWQPAAGEAWEEAVDRAPRRHHAVAIGDEIRMSAASDRPGCEAED